MSDIQEKILELMDLFDDDEVTTANKIPRPQSSLDKEAFDDFNIRNPLAGGGMLVQPSADGSRPGYSKSKKKINRDESYRKVVKDFAATSGPGTGSVFDDPAAIDIVKAELNRIKKRKNNKDLFEWSEGSKWYKNLQKRLNPNTKKGLNREFTNKLINQVVDEFFPGAYHGKDAMFNFRNDMVVKSFIQHLKSIGEFDGQEKFDPVLDQFTYRKDGKRKDKMHLYEDINRSWNQWRQGKFEVDGVDRAQLKKELKARGINYSQIDEWKASAAQARGVKKIAEIKFLDNQNTKFPNRTSEQVEKLFKQKFPNGNFYLRVNDLTQLKNTGVYVSGATSEKSITGIDKGERATWLKRAYGRQFAGNYSKIINAADQLAAAGETAKAQRLYNAADKFFGPKGIIRKSAVGEAEHALARSFDFLNPDRQLAINSIVSGDLNQFKKNLFDIPVKKHFIEYNKPETTPERRKELKNLIEDRRKVMNALTGGQQKGIVAGDTVKFRYGKNSITATSNVPAVDTLFKQGKFNIDDFIERGNKYGEAFQTIGSKANIIDKSGQLKITKPVLDEKQFTNIRNKVLELASTVTDRCPIGNADGGRIGYSLGSEACFKIGKQKLENIILKGGAKGKELDLAKTILRAGGGVKSLLSLRGALGPAAMAFTAATEAGLVGYDMLAKGQTFREAVGDSLFNYALGDKTKIDPRSERYKSYQAAGVDQNTLGKIAAFENTMDEVQYLQQEFDKEGRLADSILSGRGRGRMSDAMQQKQAQAYFDQRDSNRLLLQDLQRTQSRDRMDDALDPVVPFMIADADAKRKAFQLTQPRTKAFGDFMDVTFPSGFFSDTTFQEDRDRAVNYMPNVQEYRRGNQFQFADGGLSGGDKSGPPPESGPTPHGLPGILKRAKNI